MIVLWTLTGPAFWKIPPPLAAALLSMVTKLSETVPVPSKATPPPSPPEWLLLMLQPVIVRALVVLLFDVSRPPPSEAAQLPLMVQLLTEQLPRSSVMPMNAPP